MDRHPKHLAALEGFEVLADSSGVVVRKRATPLSHWCFLLPFLLAAPVLTCLAAVAAVVGLIESFARKYDNPIWLAPLVTVVFATGTVICLFGFLSLLRMMLPGTRRVSISEVGYATCESAVWGFVYWRKRLRLPLELVAPVYQSRGEWLCNASLRGADGRKYSLMIPTSLSSSKSHAARKVRAFVEAIAGQIDDATVTGLDEGDKEDEEHRDSQERH